MYNYVETNVKCKIYNNYRNIELIMKQTKKYILPKLLVISKLKIILFYIFVFMHL